MLIIVVVIIGILTAGAVLLFNSVSQDAANTVHDANIRTLSNAGQVAVITRNPAESPPGVCQRQVDIDQLY